MEGEMGDVISLAAGNETTIALAEKAIKLIRYVRMFMKTQFNDHHKTHADLVMSAVKENHCRHNNLGVKDTSDRGGCDTECGHIHEERCKECDMTIDFLDSCYEAIQSLGHQIRLVHESEYIASVN